MTIPASLVGLSNSDWIAISSAVVAILAFFATAWQAWLAWVHNRLIVTPKISSTTSSTITDNGIEIKLTVSNVGVGPALVVDRYFTIDGQRFDPNGKDLVAAVCQAVLGDAFKYRITHDGMFGGKATLPPSSEIIIVQIFFPGLKPEAKPAIFSVADKAAFVVRYKSLYGKEYRFSTDN